MMALLPAETRSWLFGKYTVVSRGRISVFCCHCTPKGTNHLKVNSRSICYLFATEAATIVQAPAPRNTFTYARNTT